MSDLTDAIHDVMLLRCEDHPSLLPVVAAARRVAEAPEISHCTIHNYPTRWPTATNCRHGADVGRPEDCRMVRKLLVDP